MTTMRSWQEMVNEAIEAPTVAAADGRVSADALGRAALARRVAGAHERALDAARDLRDDVQRLITALEREGIGAVTSGNGFAARAREVSGAVIRLNTAREIFAESEGYRRAERDLAARQAPAPRLGTGEPAIAPATAPAVEPEEEEHEENEEEETED